MIARYWISLTLVVLLSSGCSLLLVDNGYHADGDADVDGSSDSGHSDSSMRDTSSSMRDTSTDTTSRDSEVDTGTVATETCDGLDNDGDGMVDEGLLTPGPATSVGLAASDIPIRAAISADRTKFAVAYQIPSAPDNMILSVRSIDHPTSGSSVARFFTESYRRTIGGGRSSDVCHDGLGFIVVYRHVPELLIDTGLDEPLVVPDDYHAGLLGDVSCASDPTSHTTMFALHTRDLSGDHVVTFSMHRTSASEIPTLGPKNTAGPSIPSESSVYDTVSIAYANNNFVLASSVVDLGVCCRARIYLSLLDENGDVLELHVLDDSDHFVDDVVVAYIKNTDSTGIAQVFTTSLSGDPRYHYIISWNDIGESSSGSVPQYNNAWSALASLPHGELPASNFEIQADASDSQWFFLSPTNDPVGSRTTLFRMFPGQVAPQHDASITLAAATTGGPSPTAPGFARQILATGQGKLPLLVVGRAPFDSTTDEVTVRAIGCP